MRKPVFFPLSSGFTFIELLVGLGISLLLAGIGIGIYARLHENTQLDESSSRLAQMMRSARERAANGVGDKGHGIKFEQAAGIWKAILYQGDDYLARDAGFDEVLRFDSAVSVQTTFENEEVRFARGTGLPMSEGSATLTHQTQGIKTIQVNEKGMVEQ